MIAAKVPAYAAQLETPDVRDVLSARSSQLDPASALELGLLSPLGQVSPPPSSRYLLIDALDESLAWQGQTDSIVRLLAFSD